MLSRKVFEGLEKEQLIVLLEHLTSSDSEYLANDKVVENQAIVNRFLAQLNCSILKPEPGILASPTEKNMKKNRNKNVCGDKFDISK